MCRCVIVKGVRLSTLHQLYDSVVHCCVCLLFILPASAFLGTLQSLTPACHITNNISQIGAPSIPFAKYYCDICNIYSDSHITEIYNCDKCKICRMCSLGNTKDDYFHCDKCGGCIVNNLKDTHKCLVDVLKGDCCICLESIFLSKESVRLLPCGHVIHGKCLENLLKNNKISCPLCRKSLI